MSSIVKFVQTTALACTNSCQPFQVFLWFNTELRKQLLPNIGICTYSVLANFFVLFESFFKCSKNLFVQKMDDSCWTGTNSTVISDKFPDLPINDTPNEIKIPVKFCLAGIFFFSCRTLSWIMVHLTAIKKENFENIKSFMISEYLSLLLSSGKSNLLLG